MGTTTANFCDVVNADAVVADVADTDVGCVGDVTCAQGKAAEGNENFSVGQFTGVGSERAFVGVVACATQVSRCTNGYTRVGHNGAGQVEFDVGVQSTLDTVVDPACASFTGQFNFCGSNTCCQNQRGGCEENFFHSFSLGFRNSRPSRRIRKGYGKSLAFFGATMQA